MREKFGEETCVVDVWRGRVDGGRDISAAFVLLRLRSGTRDGHHHSEQNEGHKKRSNLHNRHCYVSSKYFSPASILETAHAALEFIFDRVEPEPLDHTGVVVAVREIVIQSRKTMPLAGRFHLGKLRVIELWAIDVSPVVGRGVHREARRHGAIGTNDDVVLTR